MDFLFQFAALFSAITWASSGAILKTIKFNKYFSFPFFEACISFVIMIIVILLWGEWNSILNENFDSYLFFSIAAFISCVGTVCYVIGIQKKFEVA